MHYHLVQLYREAHTIHGIDNLRHVDAFPMWHHCLRHLLYIQLLYHIIPEILHPADGTTPSTILNLQEVRPIPFL